MKTSPHLLLTTTLAIGFGASLTMAVESKSAQGYPAGATISTGHNPLLSLTGLLTASESRILTTAPSDQGMVITDIILSSTDAADGCVAHSIVTLDNGVSEVANFAVGMTYDTRAFVNHERVVSAPLTSGIYLEPGQTLQISTTQRYARSSCASSNMECAVHTDRVLRPALTPAIPRCLSGHPSRSTPSRPPRMSADTWPTEPG